MPSRCIDKVVTLHNLDDFSQHQWLTTRTTTSSPAALVDESDQDVVHIYERLSTDLEPRNTVSRFCVDN